MCQCLRGQPLKTPVFCLGGAGPWRQSCSSTAINCSLCCSVIKEKVFENIKRQLPLFETFDLWLGKNMQKGLLSWRHLLPFDIIYTKLATKFEWENPSGGLLLWCVIWLWCKLVTAFERPLYGQMLILGWEKKEKKRIWIWLLFTFLVSGASWEGSFY